jgi:hypothetical protein
MITGWVEAHELPASEHLRTVAEILSAPPSPEERRAERREQAEAEARRASAADTADNAAAAAFMARVNGTPPRNPLAAAEPPGRDREAAARRRAAIDVLKPHGLQDVITGQPGAVPILDFNMGIIESAPDLAQRAAMDRQYECERSQREADVRNRYVRAAAAQLAERYRALGLAERRRSAPATYLESHTTAAGGPAPDVAGDWERERAFRMRMSGVSYR